MRALYFFSSRKTFFYQNVLMLLLFVSLIEALSASAVYAVDGQPAFEVSPVFSDSHNPANSSYFVMNTQPGARPHDGVRVTNVGTKRGTITLYPVDGMTAANGGIAFRRRGDARSDIGAWIALSRQQLTLDPGESQTVPFAVTIPAHVRPGEHVGGIVADTTTLESTGAKNVSFNLQQLIILAVRVNLPGTPIEKLVVTGIHLNNTSTSQRLQVGLSNAGTVMFKSSGTLQIFDSKGQRLQSRVLKLGLFVPQTSINGLVSIKRPGLPIGRYKVVLDLTYGHAQQLHYTTLFTVTSSQKTLANAAATLVSLGDVQGALGLLLPWQLALGGGIVLLVVLASAFGLYKLFMLVAWFRSRSEASVLSNEEIGDASEVSVGETVGEKLTKRRNVW